VARAHNDFDWEGAEQELHRALSLNPNSATTHNWFTMLLLPRGRTDEAVEHGRRSVELEPLSLGGHMSLGLSLTAAGRYDEALDTHRKALALHPQFEMARRELALTFVRKGMLPEAVAELERARAVGGRSPIVLGALGYVAGLAGRRDEARAILLELAGLREARYISPFELALTHLGLGEIEQALDWLERALDDRSFWFLYSIRLPFFADVRSEPRFREILRRMNLSA
jgi:serine/threonine-protein kinase